MKMSMQKVLSLVLAIVMVISMIPANVFAAEEHHGWFAYRVSL